MLSSGSNEAAREAVVALLEMGILPFSLSPDDCSC